MTERPADKGRARGLAPDRDRLPRGPSPADRPETEHEHAYKFEQGHVNHVYVCACGERLERVCTC